MRHYFQELELIMNDLQSLGINREVGLTEALEQAGIVLPVPEKVNICKFE